MLYQSLALPVLVIYDKDGYTSFERLLELVDTQPNYHIAHLIPSLGLPQFEKMDEVAAALDDFWQKK